MIREFSEEEVRRAIWENESSKIPSPDRTNFDFNKEFWETLKGDFMRVVSEFHTYDRMVKTANCSFLVLIPKNRNPTKIIDYRPISLIGYIYKVILKILANILKKVLSSIISESQSAYITGRQILDGVLVANEIVDEAKRKKKEVIISKVDFEKAYDLVDWIFLSSVMETWDFTRNGETGFQNA